MLDATATFETWSICLTRWVLQSRTDFAWHLMRSFSVRWRSTSTSTAALPLPVPFPGCFDGSGPKLSAKRLACLARKRVTHILVILVNYLYLGRFATAEELGRQPSRLQRACLQRLSGFVAACGSRLEEFKLPPGRSGPELIACLDRLERYASSAELPAFGYGDRRPLSYKGKAQVEAKQKDDHPVLQPYRSLCVDRLKITGNGAWPLADYLHSDLWLAYVEPMSLLHGLDVSHLPVPNFSGEDRNEYLKLAKCWDDLNLLHLHPSPLQDGHFCKVFGAFKNDEVDRQIGDRRLPNAREFGAGGPSSQLPTGPMLLGFLAKRGYLVRGSLTDRRDFYHQAAVTPQRSRSNMVPFSFTREELAGLTALDRYDAKVAKNRKLPREEAGDHLEAPVSSKASGDLLYPCFGALFQGDHLGVEFALEGHQNLLVEEGLLHHGRRILGHAPTPRSLLWEGLIIDDYFTIGVAERGVAKEESNVFQHLARARFAYDRHSLPGSPEKDVVAEDLFKAAGAEVDSRDSVVAGGHVLVGAPLAKRLGLSTLTLRATRLPIISSTLACRLSGSWVSALLYRRCLASIVQDFFALANDNEDAETVFALPRKSASELVMLACSIPLMASDISAPVSRDVYATDASLSKGAIVKTKVAKITAEVLWLDGDRKGAYTKLDNGFRAALRSLGEDDDHDIESERHEEPLPIEKPPLFRFDFVECFGGAGKVSAVLASMNFVVAPVLDLSFSPCYDFRQVQLLHWVIYMLSNNYIRSAFCAPPCTTFSPAAHPACRSYEQPLGWDRTLPKVLLGNVLAFRSLTIMYVCHINKRPGGLEQTRLSKMAWLRAWRWLLSLGCSEAVVASCNFGSPHRKEFRLLLTGIDAEPVTLKCKGGHKHLQIQGSLTKPSAVYTDGVARHFALAFARALEARRRDAYDAADRPGPRCESILVNDLLRSSRWCLERVWFWRSQSHINLLETSVVVSLLKQMIVRQSGSRFSVLLDSAVAKGALAKGRSSSKGLLPLLRKAAACQLAGNLYPSHSYAPTKLNVADDPIRDQNIREAAPTSILDFLSADEVRSAFWNLERRPVANWIRITILAVCVHCSDGFRPTPALPDILSGQNLFIYPSISFGLLTCLLFWGTLGFGLGLLWICSPGHMHSGFKIFNPKAKYKKTEYLVGFHTKLWTVVLFSSFASAVAPMAPETATEQMRSMQRRAIDLAPDRVLRKQTRENRVRLLSMFETWLWEEQGIVWAEIFNKKPVDAEEICHWLCLYGRQLHATGKSYNRYAETINGITALRPILKRQVTAAWDLAFAWLVDEPHQHHPALPMSILVAMTCLALIWGWPVEAAIFSMTWTGLLRIGEVLQAVRGDLILPHESAPGINYILLRISEPKTRGRGARHQSAKIEPADIVALVTSVFRRHSRSQRLWPLSAQTLRRRFNCLLEGLGLPTKPVRGQRPYDLGSLRPGGATFLLNKTEDTSLLQRRGRWLSYKVMNIYLQEISVATAEMTLSDEVREKIHSLNSVFPQVLSTAVSFIDWQLPPSIWNLLFQNQTT